jgi:hypothetical protein
VTGPGRPSTGTRIAVRIPADDLAVIDAFAWLHSVTRAEVLREAVSAYAATLEADREWIANHAS